MAPPGRRESVPFVILDEIALEGLEGITLSSLWVYLGVAFGKQLPLSLQLKNQVWCFIKRNIHQLRFYELPKERATVKYVRRIDFVDPDFNVPLVPAQDYFPRYKFVPIEDGEIKGSCEFYKERKKIRVHEVRDMTIDEVQKRWGDRFIIVASQELRYKHLTPENIPIPQEKSIMLYCVWEAIGRSRSNGETISGEHSLLNFCTDSTFAFYLKKKLIQHGVIAQKSYNEIRNDKFIVTSLLTLPRFNSNGSDNPVSVIEKIFMLLKEAPNHRMTVLSLRTSIPNLQSKKAFKRIALTHIFREIFELRTIDKEESGAGIEENISRRGKRVKIVSLRNPDLPLEDLFGAELEIECTSDNDDSSMYESHAYVDNVWRDEIYRGIVKYGGRGCSVSELCEYLNEEFLSVRLSVKKMHSEGLLRTYYTDTGRQRVNRYVALENVNLMDIPNPEHLNESIDFQYNKLPDKLDETSRLVDIPDILANLRPYVLDERYSYRDNHTARYKTRKDLIKNLINENYIMQTCVLRKKIQCEEEKLEYKVEICIKSLRRILYNLLETNSLKAYELTLQFEEIVRTYRFITHPKMDIDHILLKQEVLKLKNSFFLNIEREKLRRQTKSQKITKLNCSKRVKSYECKFNKEKPLRGPISPKFLISRSMHEYLFYVVVELNKNQEPIKINEQLLEHWHQLEPRLIPYNYKQEVSSEQQSLRAYTREITWRTFIPPLPDYSDKPAGWVYFRDALERLPLSIFNKIFRIEKVNEDLLLKYLSHPVRQHYLIQQLPIQLQSQMNQINLQRVCTTMLKLLNNMGLIQVSELSNPKDPLSLWVYLNRSTKIFDTTTSEASYVKVDPNRKYDELHFNFSNFDDVSQYWNQLHRICVYTKLGFRKNNTAGKVGRSKELSFDKTVSFDDAPKYDEGKLPGDGAGAAGLSTQLFAHNFRNWSWMLHTNNKISTTKAVHEARKAMGHNKQYRTINARKRSKFVAPVKLISHGIVVKRSIIKKSSNLRDATDRDALKNMRTLRVTWDKNEDNLLKMARAVYVYISAPVTSLELMTVGKICRDIIRHYLGIVNKTSQACVRRMHFIVKMKRHIPEVPSWIHILHTSDDIQNRYGENFLQKLKNIYPSRFDFCSALEVHFINLMSLLYQKINESKEKSFLSAVSYKFLTPNTILEFKNNFIEVPNEKIIQYENPNTEYDQQVALAIGVLHSSLCSAQDKTSYASQSFEIYKNFPEDVLHAAFSKARNNALVVTKKRKNIQMLPSHLAGPAYSLSSQYQRRLSLLFIPYGVYDAFFKYFENALGTLFKTNWMENKASTRPFLTLKSPNTGHLFFIAEGSACGFWNCSIKLPINILTIDAAQRQTISPMDRILDHYHSIFDNAPVTEYTKNFESEPNGKQARVKFHPANLSYKINYSPYDFISKLPLRYLHFFCALDHLNQDVDINFSKLHRKDAENNAVSIECPFNCVLKEAHYLHTIERIVHEKRVILSELCEMPAQKLLNLAVSDSVVPVQSSNLITLVRMLESFWRDKEAENDLKDLGKVSPNVKINHSIDWYHLCNEILNFDLNENDKSDEYEPTLNKEERIARAQDVFVVNLPTLQLEVSPTLNETAKCVQYNGERVPECLLEPEMIKDKILQKIFDESHWEYTENNFYTMKEKLELSNIEEQQLETIYNFIEPHKFGVDIKCLLEFPNRQFLSRGLQILCSNFLIKRVGYSTVLYIHKSHIRHWVVHTFHIKRLEREKLGISLKRKYEKMDECGELSKDQGINYNKRSKLNTSKDISVANTIRNIDSESNNQAHTSHSNTGIRNIVVIKPQPWIRLNGSINRRVLDRWLGSVLTECISRTGCMVYDICVRFSNLPPADIMFLLQILSDLKCLHLTEIQEEKINLLSFHVDLKETIVYDLYDPERTFITAHTDALTRMAVFIGNKKYNKQFLL